MFRLHSAQAFSAVTAGLRSLTSEWTSVTSYVLTLRYAFDNLEQHLQKGVPMKAQLTKINRQNTTAFAGVAGIPMLNSKWSGVFFGREA